jgi:NhaP-type Na+/H+ or K+/H+ antiporter
MQSQTDTKQTDTDEILRNVGHLMGLFGALGLFATTLVSGLLIGVEVQIAFAACLLVGAAMWLKF